MTEPNELCAQLHNRMPAILAPEAWPAWLGEEPADLARRKALLVPYPSEGTICWPVSPRVGNVRNNDSSLIEPVAGSMPFASPVEADSLRFGLIWIDRPVIICRWRFSRDAKTSWVTACI